MLPFSHSTKCQLLWNKSTILDSHLLRWLEQRSTATPYSFNGKCCRTQHPSCVWLQSLGVDINHEVARAPNFVGAIRKAAKWNPLIVGVHAEIFRSRSCGETLLCMYLPLDCDQCFHNIFCDGFEGFLCKSQHSQSCLGWNCVPNKDRKVPEMEAQTT